MLCSMVERKVYVLVVGRENGMLAGQKTDNGMFAGRERIACWYREKCVFIESQKGHHSLW